ncbi:hypothetical protein KBY22_12300 [Ruegeria pomeroyi]|uniref:Uncharacterized protein n=1 Tax=Ruegeria alba TaxID=2916756 RepID=A0ABS9NYM4_9RHOB|nr:hypothetical protein [Ruegeria alba]MCE8513484.1 hypothetical protein [Ruegeria pomeroyi]MCE8515752.1 hypothetical protein [Ruegeria pomeroyi]MCE8520362.1 hypothetical protein [Ruegeria pomeroyi]MCE8525090.1 hypothetical protein [Ruegeria pomeroyi]MCE8530244.1 hypothetical protein [Ruegeria pomeroyi]
MSTYISKEVGEDLARARIAGLKKMSRLRVEHIGMFYTVLRLWRDGFAVEAESTPPLRGLVDIYEGPNLLYQCLIVASGAEGGEMVYEFKRQTLAQDHAPLDFERGVDAPIGLLGKE